MTFRIGPYEWEHMLHVCKNLRAMDKKELSATTPNFTPEVMAGRCLPWKDYLVIAYDGGEPIAVIGALKIHPGLWMACMFATDNFHRIALSMTRWTRRVYLPALRSMGAKRLEARSIVGHEDAHRWMLAAGAFRECVVKRVGMGGEDFVQFAYLWKEDDK